MYFVISKIVGWSIVPVAGLSLLLATPNAAAEPKPKVKVESSTSTTSTSTTTTQSTTTTVKVAPTTSPMPPLPTNLDGNRQIGLAQMLVLWSQEQWPCLDALWTRESGWNHTADNPTSDAYGIPQSLPGSKMASKGADWQTNPATQIAWGLEYILVRYGTPCEAKAHSDQVGWY